MCLRVCSYRLRCLTDSEIAFRRQLTIEGLWRSTLRSRAHLPISVVVIGRCARQSVNRRVAALRARTAAIHRTKEVPHTLPIFSRSRVIVDHHMSICQTGRPVACEQCASRTEAHCIASLRAWRFSAAHCSASTEAPSNGLRKYHRRERHDPQSRGLLKFNNRFHCTVGMVCLIYSNQSWMVGVKQQYCSSQTTSERTGSPMPYSIWHMIHIEVYLLSGCNM